MIFGVTMNKNKKLFEKSSRDKKAFKYFIISFSVFILLLSMASAFLFMYSIDFDFNNFVNKPDSETTETQNDVTEINYTVDSLSGKSTVLFICADSKENFDFAFTVNCDFDKQTMVVKCFDKQTVIPVGNSKLNCGEFYKNHSVQDFKKALADGYQINADKYFICDRASAKEILSLFDGVTVNVPENVNYNSNGINLELEKGEQNISGAYALNYLLISNNSTREKIICDIINSVLVPEYTDNSQKLFTSFVNAGETDISVIDYSQAIEKLSIYANSEDKFLPSTNDEVGRDE